MRCPALALVALAALIGGCGGNDEKGYKDAYKVLNERLLEIGEEVETGLKTAEGKKNRQLSEQFARYALRLQTVNTAIRRLDTPEKFDEKSDNLSLRIDDVIEDLKAISGATGVGDRQQTAEAVVAFGASAQALNRAQNALARATGARIGPR